MSRRALAIAVAGALLFEAQARADAAQQAMGGLGAFLLPGVCAYIATGLTEFTEEEREAPEAPKAEAADAEEGAAEEAAKAKKAAKATAKAEAAVSFDRSGWLAGALASFQFEDFSHLGALDADDSVGMKLRLGYRCSPHLGWEFNYEWAESFDLSDGSDVDLWALTSDAKFYPFTGRWQPFLLAGVGILTADPIDEGNGTDITLRFGGGMEAYVTENVALAFDASYVLPTSKVKDLPYLSLSWGFLYRF